MISVTVVSTTAPDYVGSMPNQFNSRGMEMPDSAAASRLGTGIISLSWNQR